MLQKSRSRKGRVARVGGILLFVGLGLIASCDRADLEPTDSAAVNPPPSLRDSGGVEVVRLDADQAETLDVITTPVVRGSASLRVSMPGTVHPAPDHVAMVSAPISGRVVRIYAHEGERVVRGQTLAELESLEFASLVSDYVQARADEAYQNQQVARLQLLVDQRISPRSTLEKAQSDQLRARAMVQSASARLGAVGVTAETLDEWMSGAGARPVLRVRAPIAGVVNRHLIDLGQSVASYELMMDIVDDAVVLVRGYVSPEDAALLRAGDPVRIETRERSRAIDASIATINPALDAATRSVTVNIHVRAAGHELLPGQSVRVLALTTSDLPVLAVPLSAVHYDGRDATVFVRTAPDTFEKRVISIARTDDDQVIVQAGLEGGEEVAVSQVFSLKALGRFDQYAEE
jgi:membrane fusion protein, heavy metal efflux system